jgi:hypothetical protein
MESPILRRNRLALWYENTPRPHWALALLIILLFAPTLGDSFMIDDHRCIRVIKEYESGARPSPNIYEFLAGGDANLHERETGWYPWWMSRDLRYRHLRPLTEWALYAQYRIFGDHAPGFRVVSLAMYIVGVWLVLALLRFVGRDERIARWGALIFAVGAPRAVPVVFVSAQCDLIALITALAALLIAGRFIEKGGMTKLIAGAMIFGVGLFSKEAVFPCAALPACMALCFRDNRAAQRRAIGASTLYCTIAILWLGYYVKSGYGASTALMLDPINAPRDYFAQAPLRIVILLATWLIPVNPFLLEFQFGAPQLNILYAAIGAVAILAASLLLYARHRRQRGLATMALWPLAFMPVLACTPPDDRVMVLPGVSLAFLSAMWMTYPRENGSFRLRMFPFFLFVVVHAATSFGIGPLVNFMETETQRKLRHMASDSGPIPADGWIFVVNNAYPFEGLFMQDRHRHIGLPGGAMLLADCSAVKTTKLDDYTLRVESTGDSLLTGFLGKMGTTRGQKRLVGDESRIGPAHIRVSAAKNGAATTIDVKLDRPLDWPGYRFYETNRKGMPILCKLPDSVTNNAPNPHLQPANFEGLGVSARAADRSIQYTQPRINWPQ